MKGQGLLLSRILGLAESLLQRISGQSHGRRMAIPALHPVRTGYSLDRHRFPLVHGVAGIMHHLPDGLKQGKLFDIPIDPPLPAGSSQLVGRNRATSHKIERKRAVVIHPDGAACPTHPVQPEDIVFMAHAQEGNIAQPSIIDPGQIAYVVAAQHLRMIDMPRRFND